MLDNNQKSEFDKQTFKGSTSLSLSICKSCKLQILIIYYVIYSEFRLSSE